MFGESFISINLETRWCNLLNRLLSYDLCTTLVFKKYIYIYVMFQNIIEVYHKMGKIHNCPWVKLMYRKRNP
jgi:uncharacterized membrane protein YqhA